MEEVEPYGNFSLLHETDDDPVSWMMAPSSEERCFVGLRFQLPPTKDDFPAGVNVSFEHFPSLLAFQQRHPNTIPSFLSLCDVTHTELPILQEMLGLQTTTAEDIFKSSVDFCDFHDNFIIVSFVLPQPQNDSIPVIQAILEKGGSLIVILHNGYSICDSYNQVLKLLPTEMLVQGRIDLLFLHFVSLQRSFSTTNIST